MAELQNVNKHNDKNTRSMFLRITESDAIVKSQQRGERDLTQEEKLEILNDLYNHNKSVFIYKFARFLVADDLEHFNEPGNYELQIYKEKIKAALNPASKDRIVRNRRYNYLQNVLKDSDYFTDDELQRRNPLLYKQYVDQYKTEEEKMKEKDEALDKNTFSQFLFGTIDRDINNFRCELEMEAENDAEEEDDDDSDNDIANDSEFKKYLEDKIPITMDEKNRLHEEFIGLMETRFLNGEEDFDYSNIDYNENYDDMDDQDLEDKYFDE